MEPDLLRIKVTCLITFLNVYTVKLILTQLNLYFSSDSESAEEEIPEPSDDDAPYVVKSDHEFSPESDVNDEDYAPTKRARTARRDKGTLESLIMDFC